MRVNSGAKRGPMVHGEGQRQQPENPPSLRSRLGECYWLPMAEIELAIRRKKT
jgi:hypothetical protein